MNATAEARSSRVAASTPPSEAVRRRYLANLAALYRRDAALAARIDAVPFGRAPALESARDGRATVALPADDGRPIYLHSRHQPTLEAERLIDALPPVENPTFVVHGVGLGYALCELERRFAQPVVLLVENDLALMKAALCVSDLSRMIAEGRLIILTAAHRDELHGRLSVCNADLLLGVQFVTPAYSKRRGAAFHEAMRAALRDFITVSRMQMVTLLKTSRVTFQNVAWNLPSYLGSPGVGPLADAAKGYPAIVVAAGPSLARNVALLAELRSRAVIVAVQTVYKPLLALGIRPHFVTSLDFHEVSAEFFRDAGDGGDCILVAEPKATPAVLDGFPGPRAVLHHAFVDALLREAAPPRARLRPGTTVAHLAFYLAEHLGCDPILFVGQDLAYSDGLFYMPGSPIEQIWQPELSRFQTVEMKQWDRIVRNRAILRRARDLHGRDVYTDELLFTYAEQFQRDFAASRRRIIQASEGGLLLAGMEALSLRDAADRFCTRPLPDGLFAAMARDPDDGLISVAVSQLRARLDELASMRRIAEELRGVLATLGGLLDRPADFNRRVGRVDELRLAMGRHADLYNLVVDVSATAELRRCQADRQLRAAREETPAVTQARLKRDREFLESFCDGCVFVADVVAQAIDRLRGASRDSRSAA